MRQQLHRSRKYQYASQSCLDGFLQGYIRNMVFCKLDHDRKWRLLFDASMNWLHQNIPAHRRHELADYLADCRWENVNTADNQHVVSAADATHPWRGAAAGAGAGPDFDVVACAKAQERCGAVLQMRQDKFPARAIPHGDWRTCFRVNEFRMYIITSTKMHSILLFTLPPEGYANVTTSHGFGHLRAPAFFELPAECGLAATRLSGHKNTLDTGAFQIKFAFGCPFDEVIGIGRCHHRSLWMQQFNGFHQPFGVAGADGNVTQADPVHRTQSSASHKWPGVVGGNDALPRLDARGGIAARRACHPIVEIALSERDVARCASGATGGIDADDLPAPHTEVAANGVLSRATGAYFILLGQGQLANVSQSASGLRRSKASIPQLAAIEDGSLKQITQLFTVMLVVNFNLLGPGAGLNIRRQHQRSRLLR